MSKQPYQLLSQLSFKIDQLCHLIANNNYDHSFVSQLAIFVNNMHLNKQSINQYSKLMLRLYDCSNDARIHQKQLALKIRLISIQMICQMMDKFTKGQQSTVQYQILLEGAQIMILTARICLDSNYLNEVQQFYKHCTKLIDYIGKDISRRFNYIHLMNSIELMKYLVGNQQFNFKQFYAKVIAIHQLKDVSDVESQKYIQYTICEVALKLAKQGNTQGVETLCSYVPSDYYNIFKNISQFPNREIANKNMSPFYELLLKLQRKEVSQDYLTTFLMVEKNFNDSRIFDVIALSNNIMPLLVWLQIYNSRKLKTTNIKQAYKCYIYCIDKKIQLKQINNQEQTINIVQITKIVLLSVISEKKQTIEPIITIVKKIIQLILELIISQLCNIEKVEDLCEKLCVVCAKHNLSQINKVILGIQLYCQLIEQKVKQQTYDKFIKANITDKSSELVKVLKTAYQIKMNNANIDQQLLSVIQKKPYIAILFGAEKSIDIILTISINDFIKINKPFAIYLKLISTHQKNIQPMTKVVKHMEQYLQIIQPSEVSKQIQSLQNIKGILLKTLKTQIYQKIPALQHRISIIYLQLVLFQHYHQSFKAINFSLSLSKYSKIIKTIQKIDQLNLQTKKGLELILITALKKFKFNNASGVKTVQPGQTSFLQMVYRTLINNIDNGQQGSNQFIKFTMFQIRCLTSTVDEMQIKCEKDIQMFKLYSNSLYIPKHIKLQIIRKFVKDNIESQTQNQISLEDLKQLLFNTEDESQRLLYIEQIVKLHPNSGKKYLMLLSQSHECIGELLEKKFLYE